MCKMNYGLPPKPGHSGLVKRKHITLGPGI